MSLGYCPHPGDFKTRRVLTESCRPIGNTTESAVLLLALVQRLQPHLRMGRWWRGFCPAYSFGKEFPSLIEILHESAPLSAPHWQCSGEKGQPKHGCSHAGPECGSHRNSSFQGRQLWLVSLRALRSRVSFRVGWAKVFKGSAKVQLASTSHKGCISFFSAGDIGFQPYSTPPSASFIPGIVVVKPNVGSLRSVRLQGARTSTAFSPLFPCS